MIIFLSKAYNILPLVPCVKAALTDKVLSTIREQLLNEFLLDDVCPLGVQIMDIPRTVYRFNSNDHKSMEEAAPAFAIDDDALPDSFETQATHNSEEATKSSDLLSVNNLLESVLETAHHVGRISVCTAPDLSYKEMAGHCEALLMGKRQKMSYLMSNQQRQENILSQTSQNNDEEEKKASDALFDGDFQGGNNPSINWNFTNNTSKQSMVTLPMMCATEYQHQSHPFRLPASSPYDNFLKAAGC